jgi:assimilatory nitrate reductase catalytic subunit
VAIPQADGRVTIAGDRDHPANFGRLCSKGSALGETLALGDRLLYPAIKGRRVSWDEALDEVSTRFAQTLAAYGPEAVAIYAAGQILSEDYYVLNKLMKGFIGSANLDTNSRLCMASSVVGHKRAFGADTVLGTYADLEEADCVVLLGSNLAWCHPVLHQRLMAARQKRGTTIIVIDPRRTASCEDADLHLSLAPDTDVALFLGLLRYLDAHGHADREWCVRHVGDSTAALVAAAPYDTARIAAITGLEPEAVDRFLDLWARHERVVTVFSQGANQSVHGSDKVNAIINCHLLTGRIGRVGMGPFSVTGQPNAMGGREVGGLANMLAAHMEIGKETDRERVRRSAYAG